MDEFINARISGVEFEKEFFRMMRKDRDSKSYPQQEQPELESVLSRVFTACDVFNPDADFRSEYEYDETELRDFVRNILAENLSLFM